MKKEIKMDPEDLQTRLNQEIITTSDPRKMLGMYTAKRVLRTWTEDFIDQDTGELVTIERNDMIMERGVLLTPEQVSELSFYLQSGDIKEVEITNQCRNGVEYLGGGFTPWMATVKVNGKNTKMLLFAQDINQALEILKDYTELETSGSFFILGIKQRSSLIYIDSQLSSYAMNEKGEAVVDEKDDEKVVKQRFYIVDASIQNLDATQDQVEDGVDVYCQTFLLKSANADSAKKQIELYMARKAKERAETGKEAIICKYGITINAASPVGIGSVVPEDFSEAYKHAESDFAKKVEKKDPLLKEYEIRKKRYLDLYAPREGCTPCAYCGKQVPNDKLVKHRIIFQGLENGKRKIKEQVMNFCSGECAMNEQCSREG